MTNPFLIKSILELGILQNKQTQDAHNRPAVPSQPKRKHPGRPGPPRNSKGPASVTN
ncbi:hypothetical protein DPMN_138193 [Dreissena polymorpha]|uniref:Uncharacterized protein n=1 Tax=Dreissena polymorpha TaxID=45954 RepID=A0A9D4G3E9_DREPO|nr:hypothetical protein DPMN_138193 [Dreissena polymorpha]